VVEDGCVDIKAMRLEPDWPRGVLPAIADWLETTEGRCFSVRRDLSSTASRATREASFSESPGSSAVRRP